MRRGQDTTGRQPETAMKPGTTQREKNFFGCNEKSSNFVTSPLCESLKRLTGACFKRCSYAHSCRSFSLDCCKLVALLFHNPLKRLTGKAFITTVSESNRMTELFSSFFFISPLFFWKSNVSTISLNPIDLGNPHGSCPPDCMDYPAAFCRNETIFEKGSIASIQTKTDFRHIQHCQ